jgi:glutamate N-acetyltransferase/amino-acid N-acetyltransferase
MAFEMESALKQVSGVECSSIASGIKNNGALDLSLIFLSKGSTTAAVFTQNVFCAAPVLVAKNHLSSDVRALLINSGNANAGTGEKGLDYTFKVVKLLLMKLLLTLNKYCLFRQVLLDNSYL